MSKPLPTEQDWQAWLEHPCTEALREIGRRRAQTLMESWLNGAFQEDTGLNAKAIGEGQAYAKIAEMDYESMVLTELKELEDGPKPGE